MIVPTDNCETCELNWICNACYVSMPNYSLTTCEVFKNAIREYGGVEKLCESIVKSMKFCFENPEKIDKIELLKFDNKIRFLGVNNEKIWIMEGEQ